jgi:outer membrane protein with beta-barrel domain
MRLVSILMVLAFFGGESMAMAQEVRGGVKVGVTFATLSDDSSQDVDLDSRTGLVAGGFVTWKIREHFGIQLEGLYTQKGAAFDQMGVSGTTKLDYFEVPVLFVYSTAPTGSAGTSFQFFGGPSAAFKVSAKGSGAFQGETVDVDIPDEDINGVDLGVVIGAGVAFGPFAVDGRYTVGLSNINADERDSTKVRNRAFAVLAGFRF